MIKLNKLILLQVLFAIMTLTYLFLGMWKNSDMGILFSTVLFIPSIILVPLYGLSLLLACLPSKLSYRAAMLFAIIVFGGGGVIGNIAGHILMGKEFYDSFWALLIIVLINSFGTILNFIAFLGRFTTAESSQ